MSYINIITDIFGRRGEFYYKYYKCVSIESILVPVYITNNSTLNANGFTVGGVLFDDYGDILGTSINSEHVICLHEEVFNTPLGEDYIKFVLEHEKCHVLLRLLELEPYREIYNCTTEEFICDLHAINILGRDMNFINRYEKFIREEYIDAGWYEFTMIEYTKKHIKRDIFKDLNSLLQLRIAYKNEE